VLKKTITLFLISIWINSLSSQVIKGYDPDNDLNKLVFNEIFIEKNRVKKINGKKSFKKVGDVIRQTQNVEFFEFERTGTLKQFGYTSLHQKDTVCQFYEYANQLLLNEGISNRDGGTVDEYEYDNKGRPVKKSKVKYYTDLEGKEFRTAISEEKISYNDISQTSWKATYYNTYDKPYKTILSKYNESGFLLSEIETFLIGNRQITTSYSYNEKAFLTAVEVEKTIKEKTVFKYNSIGELVRVEFYKNDKLDSIREFFYNSNTALLSSSFTKEEDTGLIHIVKYNFEFY